MVVCEQRSAHRINYVNWTGKHTQKLIKYILRNGPIIFLSSSTDFSTLNVASIETAAIQKEPSTMCLPGRLVGRNQMLQAQDLERLSLACRLRNLSGLNMNELG